MAARDQADLEGLETLFGKTMALLKIGDRPAQYGLLVGGEGFGFECHFEAAGSSTVPVQVQAIVVPGR